MIVRLRVKPEDILMYDEKTGYMYLNINTAHSNPANVIAVAAVPGSNTVQEFLDKPAGKGGIKSVQVTQKGALKLLG